MKQPQRKYTRSVDGVQRTTVRVEIRLTEDEVKRLEKLTNDIRSPLHTAMRDYIDWKLDEKIEEAYAE